jgi:hypothetical protein
MDYSKVEATIVLSAAAIVGLICGLLPLGIGVWRRRTGLGLFGCATCILAGLALGIILALPTAIICAAGVYRAPQWNRQEGHSFQITRLPMVCTIVFSLAIVLAVALWIILVGLTPLYAESVFQDDTAHLFENGLQGMYAVGWCVLFITITTNFLLLLRYRLGLWLGCINLLWIIALPVIVYCLLDTPQAKALELKSSHLMLMLYCDLAMAALYCWALASFASWSRSLDAQNPPHPPNVPEWMSTTRFTPDRGHAPARK